MGRPPKPIEQRRRTGRRPGVDSAGKKLPDLSAVVALPMVDAEHLPDAPDDLMLPGLDLWRQVWTHGQRWVSTGSDRPAVELACRLADDLERTRAVFRVLPEPQTGRLIVAMTRELGLALSRLGFDPTSRGRLGVAEVKAASALDQLLTRRAQR